MNAYKENALNTLAKLVSFKTVKGQPQINAPFGEELKKCLDYFLDLGKSLGFTVKNVDGYAGHIEWKGKTDEIVGILAHLDVVPEGEGWRYPPYKATIEGDYVYGRGVLDDKGPATSCLYAMKELKDNGFIPTKTIRLIVGCDEENGSSCVKYYFEREKMPDVGFSPDGDFPAIHCEKSTLWLKLNLQNDLKFFKNVVGGEKANMVPSLASADYYGDLPLSYFENLGVSAIDMGGYLKISAFGKNAHGSTPDIGENALWTLFKVISTVENNSVARLIYNTFCRDCSGIHTKIACQDEKSGVLTQNLGVAFSTNDLISLTLDIRSPLAITKEQILDKITQIAGEKASISVINYADCLFVDPESTLVKTLMSVYKKHTDSNSPSLIIGGGTYAKEMKYGIAFGPMMENEDSTIHMPNERLSLKNFSLFYDIYKDAIFELSK